MTTLRAALLLNHHADINLQAKSDNCGGETALHYALFYRNFDIATILLEHGARVDIINDSGDTALHWLCRGNISDSDVQTILPIIDRLIKAGAEIAAFDKDGYNWLNAISSNEIRSYLIERGEKESRTS